MDNYIAERRQPILEEKEKVFRLISDCYTGGYVFKKNNHLFQYSRENTAAYKKRTERSIYINHVQPLADMLTGFLYLDTPEREYPDKIKDFLESSWKNKDFDSAMHYIATRSLLFTTGILIDSPKFDQNEILTEADRESAGLHPYLTIYYPWQIRDFSYDAKGNLDWVLLDDTEIDNSSPYEKPVEIKKYKLWTKEYFQTIFLLEDEKGSNQIEHGDIIPHPCGQVPFILANWKDTEMDFISDSVFEDIGYMSRSIYNYFSYLDEILASSAFKSLFFPVNDVKHDIPASVQQKGFAETAIIPYNGNVGGQPFFAGPDAGDVSIYLEMMKFLSTEIFKKLGLDDDDEKNYVQSAEAKRREFQKASSLIRLGATVLEGIEKEILSIVCKWMGLEGDVEVKYSMDYDDEEIETKLTRLRSALEVPVFEIQKKVYALMLKAALKEDIDKKELDKLIKLVEKMEDKKVENDLDSYFGEADGDKDADKPVELDTDKNETPGQNPGK